MLPRFIFAEFSSRNAQSIRPASFSWLVVVTRRFDCFLILPSAEFGRMITHIVVNFFLSFVSFHFCFSRCFHFDSEYLSTRTQPSCLFSVTASADYRLSLVTDNKISDTLSAEQISFSCSGDSLPPAWHSAFGM